MGDEGNTKHVSRGLPRAAAALCNSNKLGKRKLRKQMRSTMANTENTPLIK